MKASGKCLLALETLEQIAAFGPALNDTSAFVVVALSAEVDDRLDVMGIVHATIEDFYSESVLMKQAADNNGKIDALCASIDGLMGVQFGSKLPDFSAYYHRGRLRVMFDAFQRAAFCIGAMLDELAPSKVMTGQAQAPDVSQIWVSAPDFLSYTVAELCRRRGIECATTPVHQSVEVRPGLVSQLVVASRGLRNVFRSMLRPAGDIAFFFWPEIPGAELKRVGLRPVGLPEAPRQAVVSGPKISLASLEPHFIFGYNNLYALAERHIRAFVENFRVRNLKQLRRTERIVSRSGAKACLATAPVNIEAVNALLAARRANIPAIVLQHGGFNGYAEYTILPFTDFNLNDHYFCYGAGVAESLAPMAEQKTLVRQQSVAVTPTGSSSIHAIYKNRALPQPGSRRRVIYVPAILGGSIRYMAGHLRPDIAYWRQQRNVLKLLMSHPDWEIHLRPPPPNLVRNPLTDWLERQAGTDVRLRGGDTFGSLLTKEHFDLVVTDAVTTVMLEALATRAQVVTQFDQTVMTLRPEAETLLKLRAAVTFAEEDFLAEIDRAMKLPVSANMDTQIDDSFLMRYALTGANDEPGALQVSAVQEILSRKSASAAVR
jgi:hypothetical protein